MNKILKIIILSVTFNSCNRTTGDHDFPNTGTVSSNRMDTFKRENTKPDSIIGDSKDSIIHPSLAVVQKLIDSKVLPDQYNLHLFFYENKYVLNDSVEVFLLKSYVDSLDLLQASNPILNFVIISRNNKTTLVLPISSSHEKDVTYLDFYSGCIFFNCYSSPVGYSQILLINPNDEIYISKGIDENQTVDIKSLNLRLQQYVTLPDSLLHHDLKKVNMSNLNVLFY